MPASSDEDYLFRILIPDWIDKPKICANQQRFIDYVAENGDTRDLSRELKVLNPKHIATSDNTWITNLPLTLSQSKQILQLSFAPHLEPRDSPSVCHLPSSHGIKLFVPYLNSNEYFYNKWNSDFLCCRNGHSATLCWNPTTFSCDNSAPMFVPILFTFSSGRGLKIVIMKDSDDHICPPIMVSTNSTGRDAFANCFKGLSFHNWSTRSLRLVINHQFTNRQDLGN